MSPQKKAGPKPHLNAYGPDGLILARSYDAGKSWQPTAEGLDYEAKRTGQVRQARVFTRRIAAVVNQPTPEAERRIAIPFSELHQADILAGWAPYDHIDTLEPNSLDALTVTDLNTTDAQIARLKQIAPVLLLDLPSTISLQEAQPQLDRLLPQVEAVTVANELLAARLRPYHGRIFVIPDLVRPNAWVGRERPPAALRNKTIRVGVPLDATDAMRSAIAVLGEKFGDKAQWGPFDPTEVFPGDEPAFYHQFDVILVPAPKERHHASAWRILPPQMAECTVVADRAWPHVAHDQTGLQVGKDAPIQWTSTLQKALQDSMGRIRWGRLARSKAKRISPETRLNQIVLPYRLVVPKGEPVEYV